MKKAKTKKKKARRAANFAVKDSSTSLQKAPDQQVQKQEIATLTLREKIEQKIERFTDPGLKYSSYTLLVSMLSFMLIVFLCAYTPVRPNKTLAYTVTLVELGFVSSLLACGTLTVCAVLIFYRKLKRRAENVENKILRSTVNLALRTILKPKNWAYIGAPLLLLILGEAVNLSSVQSMLTQYKLTALSIFIISLVFYPLVGVYIMYLVLIKPYVNIARDALGLTALPEAPPFKQLGLLAGGLTMHFTLSFIAVMLDPKILVLFRTLATHKW